MRKITLFAFIAIFFSCSILGPKSNQTNNTFTLKFINLGTYAITGFFLNPGNDSINWQQNILPVASLTYLQYVYIRNLARGPEYAFRVRFDSAGTALYLIQPVMRTESDIITAMAAMDSDSNWGIGSQPGLAKWTGEVLVGQ